MTFENKKMTYRIMLDTFKNIFIAVNAADENDFAYGVTIEQAVTNLTKK